MDVYIHMLTQTRKFTLKYINTEIHIQFNINHLYCNKMKYIYMMRTLPRGLRQPLPWARKRIAEHCES